MNPSTAELLAAVEASPAAEVVVLPNDRNVLMAAEHAAENASKPVAGRADRLAAGGARGDGRLRPGARRGRERRRRWREAAADVATGAVTVASRDVELERRSASARARGSASPTGSPSRAARRFDEVARAVLERLLERAARDR